MSDARWSSTAAFNIAAVGAAVGLGSVWRFPYLAGTHGGSLFLFAFILACLLIAAPLLVAEYLIGRSARRSPPEAAGALAVRYGAGRGWNAIGQLGTVAALVIMSYYTVVAGWVLAYAWYCASGTLTALEPGAMRPFYQHLLADPVRLAGWQLAVLAALMLLSMGGIGRGVERATRVRAPALLVLLLLLVGYALWRGSVRAGLAFAFAPHWEGIGPEVAVAAIGQAFFATGVGMGMMLAYGAYIPAGVSLIRSSLIVCAALIGVSILSSIMIFPLVFAYGLDPAQGPELVFNVLPVAFAEMPAGRLIGTLFFSLLVISALTPSLAGLEPLVAWLEQRLQLGRAAASFAGCLAIFVLGLPSLLSFNVWSAWRPLAFLPPLAGMRFFDVIDYVSSNVLLTAGALMSCALVAWRLPRTAVAAQLAGEPPRLVDLTLVLLRYACPLAVLTLLVGLL